MSFKLDMPIDDLSRQHHPKIPLAHLTVDNQVLTVDNQVVPLFIALWHGPLPFTEVS